jgi:hydroxyethylthiazole kinase
MTLSVPTPERIADLWLNLRERKPRVHCITNSVVQAFTANLLLAAGAIPSMSADRLEIADFVAACDGLLINLGTLDGGRRQAIGLAIDTAIAAQKPWVLDPVFIDVASNRRHFAQLLLARGPSIVRSNSQEMAALIGSGSDLARMADVARQFNTVLCVSGDPDRIVAADAIAQVANGDALARVVTGTGCALAALVAALSAVTDDRLLAAVTAHSCFGIAVERSAGGGPGTLAATLADALYQLDMKTILGACRVQ